MAIAFGGPIFPNNSVPAVHNNYVGPPNNYPAYMPAPPAGPPAPVQVPGLPNNVQPTLVNNAPPQHPLDVVFPPHIGPRPVDQAFGRGGIGTPVTHGSLSAYLNQPFHSNFLQTLGGDPRFSGNLGGNGLSLIGGPHPLPDGRFSEGLVPGSPVVGPISEGLVPGSPFHSNFERPATDESHATGIIDHLTAALGRARDPELKGSLSTALAALHKFVQGRHKEHENALQGKLSPRLMKEAYTNGPARSVSGNF